MFLHLNKSFGTCLLMLLLGTVSALAQFPGGGGRGLGSVFSGGSSGSSGPQTVVLDTSAIYHFYADNLNIIFPYRDSLIDEFQQYDPTRQQAWDWAHLGNLGSAHRPIVQAPQFRKGVDIGLHQYDLYQLRTRDVRFYKINQAYTQAYFSQGAGQGNAYFKVRFSRTFKKGLNFSIEHRRINDQGYFDNEGVDNKAFAVGFWFQTAGKRYESFLTAASNGIEVQDNGGEIIPNTGFEADAFVLNVNLNDARTRQTNREFAYTQYFYLNRRKKKSTKGGTSIVLPDSLLLERFDSLSGLGPDSLIQITDSLSTIPLDSLSKNQIDTLAQDTTSLPPPPKSKSKPQVGKGSKSPPVAGRKPNLPPATSQPPDNPNEFTQKRAFTVYHKLQYTREVYKFWDDRNSFDTVYYNDLQVDIRGLRYYLERKTIDNTFKLQTFKLRKAQRNSRLAAQKDLIEVGINHQIHFIDQESVDTSAINNLYLTGSINFTPSERLKINTYGHFALLDHAGDYRISGDLLLDFKTIGQLKVQAINQLYEPTFLQHRFYNTQQEIWKNNFDKTLETSLTGEYALRGIQLAIYGGYHLLTNYIYFDTLSRPQQTNELISLFQLGFTKNFRFGPIFFNNQLIYQNTTSDRIRIPEIYSKHSLFFEGPLFKNALIARLGVDARFFTDYKAYTYQPLTGQFHLQEEQSLPFTPLIDAFFIAKFTRFRFFFKVENLVSTISRQYYAQTVDYLQPYGFSNSGGMRLGISWRFVD